MSASRPADVTHRLHPARRGWRRQLGATLVELVVMIVVVGVVGGMAAGVVGTLNKRSADPLTRRQALAAAEALLAEALSQPTPDSDPDGGAESLGPEAGEARGSAAKPFDHVNDYDGYARTGLVAFDGTAIGGLEAYSVSVAVRAQAIDDVPAADGWWVTVTVRTPDDQPVTVSGWRARLSG